MTPTQGMSCSQPTLRLGVGLFWLFPALEKSPSVLVLVLNMRGWHDDVFVIAVSKEGLLQHRQQCVFSWRCVHLLKLMGGRWGS